MPETMNPVSEARRRRVGEMFAAIDAKDVDALLAFLAPDAIQRLGNMPPLRGHGEIRKGNEDFLGSVAGIHHDVTRVWESDEGVVVNLRVTYDRHDGKSVTIPVVTIFRETDGLIDEYEVYFDITPVFA